MRIERLFAAAEFVEDLLLGEAVASGRFGHTAKRCCSPMIWFRWVELHWISSNAVVCSKNVVSIFMMCESIRAQTQLHLPYQPSQARATWMTLCRNHYGLIWPLLRTALWLVILGLECVGRLEYENISYLLICCYVDESCGTARDTAAKFKL
jgi:hypothetical protein